MQTIYNNYHAIADAIKQLQNRSLSLAESLQIVDNVQIALQSLNDEKSGPVKEKFNSVLTKNVGFAKLRQIYSTSIPTDPLTSFKDYFTYASVTSLDVEQSFFYIKTFFYRCIRRSKKQLGRHTRCSRCLAELIQNFKVYWVQLAINVQWRNYVKNNIVTKWNLSLNLNKRFCKVLTGEVIAMC